MHRLKGSQGWTAVVLEEEGLPVLEKLNNHAQKGVFYISPPSKLHSQLSSMFGKKIGCWILDASKGRLDKYYCGSGYRSEDL